MQDMETERLAVLLEYVLRESDECQCAGRTRQDPSSRCEHVVARLQIDHAKEAAVDSNLPGRPDLMTARDRGVLDPSEVFGGDQDLAALRDRIVPEGLDRAVDAGRSAGSQ